MQRMLDKTAHCDASSGSTRRVGGNAVAAGADLLRRWGPKGSGGARPSCACRKGAWAPAAANLAALWARTAPKPPPMNVKGAT